MAEEKIPSPKEITGEVQKFTKEEIDNLRNFSSLLYEPEAIVSVIVFISAILSCCYCYI